MVKVVLNAEFKKVVRRYAHVKAKSIIDRGYALWGADMMVKVAKEQIDLMVYDAPLPKSAGPGYLEHARTRRTRQAIKRERMHGVPANWAAFQAYVDKNDYDAYYYASILNYGGKAGGRMANYKARPFWTNAAKILQAFFKRQGIHVRAQIVNDLRRG